jgi:hypothetical protein
MPTSCLLPLFLVPLFLVPLFLVPLFLVPLFLVPLCPGWFRRNAGVHRLADAGVAGWVTLRLFLVVDAGWHGRLGGLGARAG